MGKPWPENIKRFLDSAHWTFAKTYAATWPHHYIVKQQHDADLFAHAVTHIREYGTLGRFYRRKITYFTEDGLVYWTMVPPPDYPGWYAVDDETIINRCRVEDSYEYRLKHSTLP